MKNIQTFFDYIINHNRKDVSIDTCHNILIFGLITSLKPKKVLELGIGGGYTTNCISNAIKYNNMNSTLTCVDNWYDWSGKRPPVYNEVQELGANIIEMDEKDFVEKSEINIYDFIMVDGDHTRGGIWAQKIYDMTINNGIICVHDICEKGYPTLKNYITIAEEKNYAHFVFNNKSKEEEQCDSGLLVIFKT